MAKPMPPMEGGFKALEAKLAENPRIENPAAVAAKIGNAKYGKANMAKAAGIMRRKAMAAKARVG
jgi:hypothetical protein